MGPRDPWTWLLGRTPEGAWRHVAYSSLAPGQGQDPADEPRVEVVRRLIAYPPRAFEAVVDQVAALDAPARRVRWLCFRGPGADPARPYWLCFVSAMPPSRRFHFGVELFDRERLGLWFLSGFEQDAVTPDLLRPFPSRPDLLLPRLELSDRTLDVAAVGPWLREAWEDRLRFSRAGSPIERPAAHVDATDASLVLDREVLAATRVSSQNDHPEAVSARAARARLVACPTAATGGTQAVSEGGHGAAHPHDVSLHPLWRLVTTLGRDPRCEVVIVDRSVSSEHARIAWQDGTPALVDLGSKNGTRVDGQPVAPDRPRPLPPEGRIELGAVPCLFMRDAEPPDPERHRAKVAALVSKRRITQAQADAAIADAERRGITPGEALLLSRAIALDDWAPRGGGGCLVFLLATALTLLLGGCTSFGLPPCYEQDLDPARLAAHRVARAARGGAPALPAREAGAHADGVAAMRSTRDREEDDPHLRVVHDASVLLTCVVEGDEKFVSAEIERLAGDGPASPEVVLGARAARARPVANVESSGAIERARRALDRLR